jgi:regulator of sirC expression with transglutaminase-like and TPR domain
MECTPGPEFLQTAASARHHVAHVAQPQRDFQIPQSDWQRLLAVQERLIVLLPESWTEYRDRGLTHAQLGNTGQALADLECYLVHADEHVNLDAIADWVDALRRT